MRIPAAVTMAMWRLLNSIPHLTLETALQTALLGIACAAVTRLFCWTLHTLEHGIPKRIPNPWLRAFAGGAAVVVFSYLFGVGRYNGAGMAVIADAVEQGAALPWDFACKIFLTALTLAVGFKGGEVVGTRIGIIAFALCRIFPDSKSAPLAICAFMILSVSSKRIGIKRRAIDIIIAISCTGTWIRFSG